MKVFNLVASAFVITVVAGYRPVPSVEVKLDASPKDRWSAAIETVLSTYEWEYSFGSVFKEANDSLFNYIPDSDFSTIASNIRKNWPSNFEELEGISTQFARYGYAVSVEYLSAWVYYHELLHVNFTGSPGFNHRECTGVLLLDNDNNVWHGRNMDQGLTDGRNLTLKLQFTMNGETVFWGLDWYWFNTGFVTGYKSGVVSLEENFRFGTMAYDTILDYIKEGRIPQVLMFREILSQSDVSFDSAVNYVNNVALGAPMYAIVGGLEGSSDGAIITRGMDDTVYLDFNNVSNSGQQWSMVETNYDHWKPDPIDDDRRTVAENLLATWQRGVDTSTLTIGSNLMAVMSSYPVHNEGTYYTGIFCPALDVFLGYIRLAVAPV